MHSGVVFNESKLSRSSDSVAQLVSVREREREGDATDLWPWCQANLWNTSVILGSYARSREELCLSVDLP